MGMSTEMLERCATDRKGPVAVHLREELLPVEGRGAVFYPPTFASPDKYNIDTLQDGTKVALVDSVGSQANRMEPLFVEEEFRDLVPQIDIRYGDEKKGTEGVVSLLQAGHRLGDAVVRCTALAENAQRAFTALGRGNAEPIARLAPTSLVFGAWDSRDTGVKVPRILRGVIRAWDVSRLTRSAQFVPALDYVALGLIESEEALKDKEKKQLAERGFVHVPATGDHGGIVATGPIVRDVTINLVALRRLGGERQDEVRRYLLGLALVAASQPVDPFLRQGCLLVPDAESPPRWTLVERNGTRAAIDVDADEVLRWAREQAQSFGVAVPQSVQFDTKLAGADMKKGKK